MSLRDMQRQFMRGVLDESAAAPPCVTPAQHLRLYANNARANFLEALQSSYPVIERLVGGPYFRQCGLLYLRGHPSRCGDLHPSGAAFADYLSELHPHGEFRYLADVARFEWLCQETLRSAAHAALEVETLARVSPDAYGAIVFQLHPALRLFESEFPVSRIWRANQSCRESDRIDLDEGGERIALLSARRGLEFHPLSAAVWSFLNALRAGGALLSAVEAGSQGGEFDPAAALRRFVLAEFIVAVSAADGSR